MDDTDTADTIQEEVQQNDAVISDTLSTPAPVDLSPVAVQSDIPLYKTERGFNIHVISLARDARENLDRVRVIDIPAPVKKHRIGRSEFEAPTLSEVGGGNKTNFCQVIAGKDGRPVIVDDIHYINTDPTRTNMNHGTASVGLGNYFSVGWSMKADLVILIYEIIKLSEYIAPSGRQDNNDKNIPVARLTCQLVGFEITNWKTNSIDVPAFLSGLLAATKSRMRNDTDIPFYMDIFRMVKPLPELNAVANEALSSEEYIVGESDYQFMTNVMNEILDIRFSQYEALPPNTPKRKVDMLRLVETLTLHESGLFIDITLTPIRTDMSQTTFRLRLTPGNFADESNNTLIERGLTLNHSSFDRLKIDLENRREKNVIVHLTSLR